MKACIMDDVAIKVRNLVKEFDIYEKPRDIALELLTGRKRHRSFRALDNLSFDVPRGQVLGIIGSNGAGKSTLLKIITGVLEATSGSVELAGRVTAILELGLGFNPEYSGRENIYLSGLLYGMDREEVDSKLTSIIDFSGLAAFIEQPTKTYSSGMQARLAFSIATAVDPDILIIDEALAAGDAMFVQKCLRRIRQLCSGGRTVLLVSHGTGLLAQFCTKVLWLEGGQVRMEGGALAVVQAYDLAAHQGADGESWIEEISGAMLLLAPESPVYMSDSAASFAAEATIADETTIAIAKDLPGPEVGRNVFRRGPVYIESVVMLNEHGEAASSITTTRPFGLRIVYTCEGELPKDTLGTVVAVNRLSDLGSVFQWYTQFIRPDETRESFASAPFRPKVARRGVIDLAFASTPMRKDRYLLSVGLLPNQPGTWEFYEYRHLFYPFSVDDGGLDVGAPMFIEPRFSHEADELSDWETGENPPKAAELLTPPQQNDLGKRPDTLNEEIRQICFEQGRYPDRWLVHTECPVCRRPNLVRSFAKYGLRHDRCALCHFVCVNPYPPEPILRALYAGAFYTRMREFHEVEKLVRDADPAYSAPKQLLLGVIEQLASEPSGAWLDVGGGIGAFAALIRKERAGWSVALNEWNARSLEIAKEVQRLTTISDTPAHLRDAGTRFDVISIISVLEHVAQPMEFVRDYAQLLKPGGRLVILVPNFTPLSANVSGAEASNVAPPFHLSLFNAENLRRLLMDAGDLANIELRQDGPAPFSLLHHLPVAAHWDTTIPSKESPEPQSFLTTPYPEGMQDQLNALADADCLMRSHFESTDGRVHLIAIATNTASNGHP